jgi:hypothetical protein
VTLSASIGSASSFGDHTSLFRILSDSLGLSGSESKGLARALSASLGSASGLVEQSSFFRSLTDSLSSGSGLGEKTALFRSLSGSWTLNPRYGRGSFYTVTLGVNFNTPSALSGHYDCYENLIVNCGTVSASFAFLVVALGVLIFGIYAAKQGWQSRSLQGELEPEEVMVDKEGWETKASEDEERSERKVRGDEQGWEEKPGG